MDYFYKQLLPSDLILLKKLLKVFGQAFSETDVYEGAIPTNGYLKSLLSKPHFIALAATDGKEVIGGLTAYCLEKFEQDRREIFIYDLAVAKKYRRQGIATGLMEELKKIAKQKKAYVIFVQADKADSPAIKLYESFGTKEDTYNFDIPVND